MGKRLHIAKKYEVEWSDSAHFNWKISEFHDLLDALDVYYTGETWDDDFEVSKEDWQKGIDTLRSYDKLDADAQETIDKALEALEYEREELIRIMEQFMEQSAPNWSYIECCFF